MNCSKKVWDGAYGARRFCARPVKKDGWCGVHHPDVVAARLEKLQKERQERSARREFSYKVESARREYMHDAGAAMAAIIDGYPAETQIQNARRSLAALRALGVGP